MLSIEKLRTFIFSFQIFQVIMNSKPESSKIKSEVSTCLICFSQLKEKGSISSHSINRQSLYDVSCKYLHSAITKELVANKSSLSNGNLNHQYPLCEKCFSSAVELVDVTKQLELFQKTIAESTLVFSLGILHRRRKNQESLQQLLKPRTGGFSEEKFLEFDVSLFSDDNLTISLSGNSNLSPPLPEELLSGKDCKRDADGKPILVSVASRSTEVPLASCVKIENVCSESEECNSEEEEDMFIQSNSSQDCGNVIKEISDYPVTGTQPENRSLQLINGTEFPIIKLKRLDPKLVANAVNGQLHSKNLETVKKRGRKKKVFPDAENYMFEKRKQNRNAIKFTSASEKLCHLAGQPKRRVGRPKTVLPVQRQPIPQLQKSILPESFTARMEHLLKRRWMKTTAVTDYPVTENLEIENERNEDNSSLQKRKVQLPRKYKSIYTMELKRKRKINNLTESVPCVRRKRGRPKKNLENLTAPQGNISGIQNVTKTSSDREPIIENGGHIQNEINEIVTEHELQDSRKRGRPRKWSNKRGRPKKFSIRKLPSEMQDLSVANSKNVEHIQIVMDQASTSKQKEIQIKSGYILPKNKQVRSFVRRSKIINTQPKGTMRTNPLTLKAKPGGRKRAIFGKEVHGKEL